MSPETAESQRFWVAYQLGLVTQLVITATALSRSGRMTKLQIMRRL